MTPTPDLLITADGRHLAILAGDGTPMMLRERSGDYVRSLIGEASGFDSEPGSLAESQFGSCSRDACTAVMRRGDSEWHVLATRSYQRIDWHALLQSCAAVDIAVSDRWLPRGCTPRWLKLDRSILGRTGGVAIFLRPKPRVETVADRLAEHPWAK
jgi:competence protein ComEC